MYGIPSCTEGTIYQDTRFHHNAKSTIICNNAVYVLPIEDIITSLQDIHVGRNSIIAYNSLHTHKSHVCTHNIKILYNSYFVCAFYTYIVNVSMSIPYMD